MMGLRQMERLNKTLTEDWLLHNQMSWDKFPAAINVKRNNWSTGYFVDRNLPFALSYFHDQTTPTLSPLRYTFPPIVCS